jgi:hypothetical protein
VAADLGVAAVERRSIVDRLAAPKEYEFVCYAT